MANLWKTQRKTHCEIHLASRAYDNGDHSTYNGNGSSRTYVPIVITSSSDRMAGSDWICPLLPYSGFTGIYPRDDLTMGKNYEMAHEHLNHVPEELKEEREAATRNLGFAAMYLCSVNDMYTTELSLGILSEETKDKANNAGREYNQAIDGLLQVNRRINEI